MTVDQLQKALNARIPAPMDATAKFAVLVPLVELEGELHLLYEVRAATLHRQPGEVCFPGGHMEDGETAVQCALRETAEELSIPPSAVRVLGPLDFICHRGGFVLYPVLAMVDAEAVKNIVPNPTEVDRVMTVPLSALGAMTPEEYSYDLVPAPGAEFPFERIGIPRNYPWNAGVVSGLIYPWQDKAIWGMTGRITQHVLSLLDAERM
ncbi:MAG: CoA pyrophosphatase [Oscillospiraceae bacterium]|nr:CoA pyrophosphatase [Oscillospiraceae bacterium]